MQSLAELQVSLLTSLEQDLRDMSLSPSIFSHLTWVVTGFLETLQPLQVQGKLSKWIVVDLELHRWLLVLSLSIPRWSHISLHCQVHLKSMKTMAPVSHWTGRPEHKIGVRTSMFASYHLTRMMQSAFIVWHYICGGGCVSCLKEVLFNFLKVECITLQSLTVISQF